ncbi:MAG: PASTA domain-containing protein [Bacteroidetes bacterium]|nr:PASTA domain-containing protein [Bacteroidota bacterium]
MGVKEIKSKTKGVVKNVKSRFWFRQIVIALMLIFIIVILAFVSLTVYTRHGKQYELPSLVGLTLDQAHKKGETLRLRLDVFDSLYSPLQPRGAILEQYPKPGSVVKKDRRVVITINTFQPKKVSIPYITGYSLRHAKNRLLSAGLEIGKLEYVRDIATNNILKQTYNGTDITSETRDKIYVGEKIDLVVGLNPSDRRPEVPNLIGMSYRKAREALWERGFNVGEVKTSREIDYKNINTAKVITQSVFAKKTMNFGSSISFFITTDREVVSKRIKINRAKIYAQKKFYAKIKLNKDTIQWLKEGRTVVVKRRKKIYQYQLSDTTKIQDNILLLGKKIEQLNDSSK